jgi:hypothetical protein
MGIRKKEFYIVVCDECKTELQNGEGGTLCLNNSESARTHAILSDWHYNDNKLLCCNCYNNL